MEIIGTGFFVTTCGTMVTAAHVAREWTEGSALLAIHQEFDGPGVVCRQIVQAILHPAADVALVRLETQKSTTTKRLLRNAIMKLSLEVPPTGSPVACWGYPQSILLPPNWQFDGFSVLLERGEGQGLVEEYFPNGRDLAMQPGECVQTSMNTMGGASGGPVFNERGEVFAVVSSGMGEHTTYVAPIRDLALARIFRVEGPKGTRLNLIEYSSRY